MIQSVLEARRLIKHYLQKRKPAEAGFLNRIPKQYYAFASFSFAASAGAAVGAATTASTGSALTVGIRAFTSTGFSCSTCKTKETPLGKGTSLA
jgi:hypothetical protein